MEAGGEEFAIGVVISAKTTLGEEFEGQIVAFDRPSNLLVIHILPKSLVFRLQRPPSGCSYCASCLFCFHDGVDHRRAWGGPRGGSGGT